MQQFIMLIADISCIGVTGGITKVVALAALLTNQPLAKLDLGHFLF